MGTSFLLSVLQIAISLAAGLTAYRLRRTGLYRRYRVLFFYMVFLAVFELSPELLNPGGPAYFYVWVCSQPILWLLDILVVQELCRVVLERHPGLFTLGRWGMYAGILIAAFLSFLSLLPHINSTMSARSRLVSYCVAAGRGVSFSLAVFLILMLFAVSRYPVPLSRNAILNAVLFTFFFLCDSLDAVLRTIFDLHMSPWLIAGVSAAQASCLLLWFARLSPEGEKARFEWIQFGPEYEKRVLNRLDALNRIVRGS